MNSPVTTTPETAGGDSIPVALGATGSESCSSVSDFLPLDGYMDVPIWAEFVPAGMRWEGLQGSPLLSGQRVGEYSVVSFAVPGESLKGALPERVLMHSDRIEEIGALATAHPGARLLLGFVTEAVKEAYAPRSVLVWPSGEVLFVGGCGRDAYTGMMNQLSSAAGTDSGSLLRAHIAGVLFLDGLAEELDTEPEAGG